MGLIDQTIPERTSFGCHSRSPCGCLWYVWTSSPTIIRLLTIPSDLYNSFLAPGSPCELNIDHSLRNALVSRMTRFELPDSQLLATANDIVQLFDQAQTSVFKLMSADSVPKFLRKPKYAEAIRKHTTSSDIAVNGVSSPSTQPGLITA